jgi:hypothetical protein
MRHDRLQALNPRTLDGNHSFMTSPLTGPFLAFAARQRFPTLFWITAGIFVVDLLNPDFIPFADEVLLGLATLILSNWQKAPPAPPASERPVIDVGPPPPPK